MLFCGMVVDSVTIELTYERKMRMSIKKLFCYLLEEGMT